MDSVTRGSGIVFSVLVAATATIVLLLPGKPAGSWPGPGTPGRVVISSAAATSTSDPPGPGSQPSARGQAGRLPAAGPRPGCHAGAHGVRVRAAGTTLRPGRAGPGAVRPRSCCLSRAHRHRQPSRRLSRYRGIRPGLP